MKKAEKKYSFSQLASAVFMIVALLWLTISAPFVFAGQQKLANQCKTTAHAETPLPCSEEESSNPFGNTTEEKAPSSSSFSEEYLHDNHKSDYFFSISSQYHKIEDSGTYIAFHGELLVPPPNKS